MLISLNSACRTISREQSDMQTFWSGLEARRLHEASAKTVEQEALTGDVQTSAAGEAFPVDIRRNRVFSAYKRIGSVSGAVKLRGKLELSSEPPGFPCEMFFDEDRRRCSALRKTASLIDNLWLSDCSYMILEVLQCLENMTCEISVCFDVTVKFFRS
jgi:hypothetical protein